MSVLLVTLGRGAPGEVVRLATWRCVLDEAEISHETLELGTRARAPRPGQLIAAAAGRAVPESLAWSPSRARGQILRSGASTVVSITPRADVADLVGEGRAFILDHVDALSRSYAQRAHASPFTMMPILLGLSAAHRRYERRARSRVGARVAAGYGDAASLGADWFPLVVPETTGAAPDPPDRRQYDVVFFGSLSYLPNIEAVERLAKIEGRRGRWRVLVAGRRPHRRVKRVVANRGWTLHADFDSVGELATLATIAVAPLSSTAGMQTKVLEAAAHGLPQVVSPEALRGMRDGFPALVGGDCREFAAAVDQLLRDTGLRVELATSARQHVADQYSPASWVEWMRELVGS